MLTTQTISDAADMTIGKPRSVNAHTSQRITIRGADGKSKAVITVIFAAKKKEGSK